MSRVNPIPAPAEPIVVKPANDIYTVLAGVALIVVIFGLLIIYMKAGTIFGGLFSAAR